MRPAAVLAVCLVGLAGIYSWSVPARRRPPMPPAAKLPASARMLLQPFHKDTVDVTVAARGEASYRVGMHAGATLVYAWSTGRKGEALDCEFGGRQAHGVSETHSAFIAQSSGWYRWRWRNGSGRPVTVRLKLNGYYAPDAVPVPGFAPDMPYDR